MKNRSDLVAGALLLATTLVMSACGSEKTNQVRVSYIAPENPAYLETYTLLKDKRHTLERIQKILAPYRLPWPLEIVAAECDGEADAMYLDGTITICYEYIEQLLNDMPAETTAAGIEPLDTVVGPFLDTVLHEFAHALFDYLDIPVLGREEDAADQVSAYIYLQLGKAEARRLIMGTVYTYMREVENTDPPSMAEFADEHSTAEQRRFNLLCMAYGADAALFKDVASWGGLPNERADICREEFELIALAYNTLIGPHIDPELAKEVYDRSWLPERTSNVFHPRKLD